MGQTGPPPTISALAWQDVAPAQRDSGREFGRTDAVDVRARRVEERIHQTISNGGGSARRFDDVEDSRRWRDQEGPVGLATEGD